MKFYQVESLCLKSFVVCHEVYRQLNERKQDETEYGN